jgi:hypothetical protein
MLAIALAKFTATAVTPGWCSRMLCALDAQEAQVMFNTGNDFLMLFAEAAISISFDTAKFC